MLDLGIIRLSSRNWASLLHMVPRKKPCDWWSCRNYHVLNAKTIHDFTKRLAGATTFWKIDLVRAYHQIPAGSEDILRTAITMPLGLFEYMQMPFKLSKLSSIQFVRGLNFVGHQYYVPSRLIVDVSSTTVGAVLQQHIDDTWHLLALSIPFPPPKWHTDSLQCLCLWVFGHMHSNLSFLILSGKRHIPCFNKL